MMKIVLSACLLGASAAGVSAAAQDVLLTGHVQRVVLQPPGTENCPPACPMETRHPDGSMTVCVSNMGGCEAMEVKVDRVYAGQADGLRTFKGRIGEFGPSFPVTSRRVVVSQEGSAVHVALVTDRDGKQFIDPKRLWKFGGLAASAPDDEALVDLDVVLARLGLQR